MLSKLKYILPKALYKKLQPAYHYSLAYYGALKYRFPSRHIFVVSVTGTKGKTTTTELISVMLEEAGFKTALSGTLHFKIGSEVRDNTFKMTTPGKFFLQKFLREAVDAGCQFAILEMSSEGVPQFRHKFIDFNALVFTNLAPEHIESHGSYENYVQAKLELARAVVHSKKERRTIIANADDKETPRFLELPVDKKVTYSLADAEPYLANPDGVVLNIEGVKIFSKLKGVFNIYNILAAAAFVKNQGVAVTTIKSAVEKFDTVPGRMEEVHRGQDYTVIVDYAHTPDSLQQVYATFEKQRKICVLGGTGGGRDTWKRKEMGAIADYACEDIILTNEDPYDEDPEEIVLAVKEGIKRSDLSIIMDRRKAIAEACKRAQTGDVVLITGKGTDPFIMGPRGTKEPWSDSRIAGEEIDRIQHSKN